MLRTWANFGLLIPLSSFPFPAAPHTISTFLFLPHPHTRPHSFPIIASQLLHNPFSIITFTLSILPFSSPPSHLSPFFSHNRLTPSPQSFSHKPRYPLSTFPFSSPPSNLSTLFSHNRLTPSPHSLSNNLLTPYPHPLSFLTSNLTHIPFPFPLHSLSTFLFPSSTYTLSFIFSFPSRTLNPDFLSFPQLHFLSIFSFPQPPQNRSCHIRFPAVTTSRSLSFPHLTPWMSSSLP